MAASVAPHRARASTTLAAPMPADLSHFLAELDTLIRARYPLIYLVTWEEQRVEALVADMARAHGKDLVEWTATRGLRALAGTLKGPQGEETRSPLAALHAIGRLGSPSLVLLKDFHRHLDEATTVRALRELAFALKSAWTTVLIVAPSLVLPEELEKEVSVLDVPLPGRQDLRELLQDIAEVVTRNKRAKVTLTPDQVEAVVAAAHGLTLAEAENAFAKAIARDARLDGDDVRLILEEKSQVMRK